MAQQVFLLYYFSTDVQHLKIYVHINFNLYYSYHDISILQPLLDLPQLACTNWLSQLRQISNNSSAIFLLQPPKILQIINNLRSSLKFSHLSFQHFFNKTLLSLFFPIHSSVAHHFCKPCLSSYRILLGRCFRAFPLHPSQIIISNAM